MADPHVAGEIISAVVVFFAPTGPRIGADAPIGIGGAVTIVVTGDTRSAASAGRSVGPSIAVSIISTAAGTIAQAALTARAIRAIAVSLTGGTSAAGSTDRLVRVGVAITAISTAAGATLETRWPSLARLTVRISVATGTAGSEGANGRI